MKIKLIILFLLFLTFSWGQKKELRLAKKLFAKEEYNKAKDLLDQNKGLFEIADLKIKSQYNLLLSSIYRVNGDFSSAFEKLKEVKKDPSMESLYDLESEKLKADCVNTAIEDSNKKNFSESVENLYIAYSINPEENIEYLYFAASNSVNAKDYSRALEYYIVLKNNKYTGIITEYFITEIENNEEKQVTKEEFVILSKSKSYTNPRSQETKSRFPEIVKNIALIHNQLGNKEMAIKAVKDARDSNPEDIDLILTEANIYIELGEKEKFRSLITEAVILDPNNANLYYNLGVVSSDFGEIVKARDYYEKAIELDPSFEASYLNLVALILDGEQELVDKMNSLGNSKADNAKYEVLRNKRESIYEECIPILKALLAVNIDNEEAIRTLMNIYGTIGDNNGYKEMKALID